jgi:hypothetical protein
MSGINDVFAVSIELRYGYGGKVVPESIGSAA